MDDYWDNYSSGESETEFEAGFGSLKAQARVTRVLYLWKLAFRKSIVGYKMA